MKFTVPHGIAAGLSALAALLPVIQTVAPAAVPGPAGIAVAGGIGLALTIGHAIYDAVKPDIVVKVLFLGLAVGVIGSSTQLTGCATVAKVDAVVTSPAAQPTITLVAEGAVLAAEAKGVTAEEINVIAKAALAADSGVTASLGAVDAAVNDAAEKAKLPAQYWPLIQLFENAVTETVAAKVGDNATVAATQAAVADVLRAVIVASGG